MMRPAHRAIADHAAALRRRANHGCAITVALLGGLAAGLATFLTLTWS